MYISEQLSPFKIQNVFLLNVECSKKYTLSVFKVEFKLAKILPEYFAFAGSRLGIFDRVIRIKN
jgi:hypothetical protein